MHEFDVIVIGGGAAGFFAALAAKSKNNRVAIVEKTAVLLSKVRISGGGRCNVTHACFDPARLVKNYPRGEKELLGPFHRFGPKDTIEWFESRGVLLKAENDGRMFPVTDSSETIIHCLINEAKKIGVEIFLRQRIERIEKGFVIHANETFSAKKLILATGSSKDGFAWAEKFGHTIQTPVPSLFTFNVPDSPLEALSGVTFEKVKLSVGAFSQTGPLLITHFGFSGPAALKLSAWAARYLYEKNYCVDLHIDWLPGIETRNVLIQLKERMPSRTLVSENPFRFPKNFWKVFLSQWGDKRFNDFSIKDLEAVSQKIHADFYAVNGKTTNKEEFVTCGGITLKEVNFKTMESKVCPGLFFAGEILDIDGITGGFNFQNAWTTGFIAGCDIEHNLII
ncbi:MAG TPA: NAD(P)/FAD-dependent oxidoreductase [Chlamydiales bacterium]|nr:NAD(P)/FAD-dependent oxidoreductase [Chlamydiales bacterium]